MSVSEYGQLLVDPPPPLGTFRNENVTIDLKSRVWYTIQSIVCVRYQNVGIGMQIGKGTLHSVASCRGDNSPGDFYQKKVF